MHDSTCLYQEIPRAALTPVNFFVARTPKCTLPAEINSIAGVCTSRIGIWHVVLNAVCGLVTAPLLLHQGKPCFKYEDTWYYASELPLV